MKVKLFGSLIVIFILLALVVMAAKAGDYPPGCPWEFREGWTCIQAEWGWAYVQDTPGPTPAMYPGPQAEPVIGEAVTAVPAIDKIDPTPTAQRMLVITHHGRGRP